MIRRATIDDLYRVEGKAELVDGQILHLPLAGELPGLATSAIGFSLHRYIDTAGLAGVAVLSRAAFCVKLPHRESFCPDAAYYEGPDSGMKFFEGAPRLAAEVRNEEDYGVVAESDMAKKRADYFAAGTLVVWDVDLRSEDSVVRVYRSDAPETPDRVPTRRTCRGRTRRSGLANGG